MGGMTATRPRRGRDFLTGQPLYWREASLCAPAMPLILLAGVEGRQLAYAAVASGAAFCVGFGAARDLRGRRWGAMVAATLGTSLAAFLGCWAGQEPLILGALAAALAVGCAILALVDEDLWWVSLQAVIALLIASYFAGPLHAALTRGGVVLAGGAAQIAVVTVLARLFPAAAQRLPPATPRPPSPRSLYVGHAVRAGVCVVACLWIARDLGLANGYWAPMTAMLVLKPGLAETSVRGFARVGGTLIGCLIATAFAAVTGYGWPWLVAGVAVAAAAAFALQKAHYAILTTAITATVVLLLSLVEGGNALLNAEHRLLATVIGGAMALVVARIAPHRPRDAHAAPDQVGGASPVSEPPLGARPLGEPAS
jgi:hypothetical protein